MEKVNCKKHGMVDAPVHSIRDGYMSMCCPLCVELESKKPGLKQFVVFLKPYEPY